MPARTDLQPSDEHAGGPNTSSISPASSFPPAPHAHQMRLQSTSTSAGSQSILTSSSESILPPAPSLPLSRPQPGVSDPGSARTSISALSRPVPSMSRPISYPSPYSPQSQHHDSNLPLSPMQIAPAPGHSQSNAGRMRARWSRWVGSIRRLKRQRYDRIPISHF